MARSAAAARHCAERLKQQLLARPFTIGGVVFLTCTGTVGVWLHSASSQRGVSSREAGLSRLIAATQLLQGFRGDPSRPVPELWTQRLGLRRAKELWNRQGSAIWWQAWSTDGEAYLVLPATLLPAADRSGLMLTPVQGVLATAADPLHRQQLLQRLKAAGASPATSPLARNCLSRLQQGPAVFWSSDGLASVSGTLAPLLQRASHGCLSLALQGRALRWQGVVGRRPLAAAPATVKADRADSGPQPEPLPAQTLLSLRGPQLADVLGALLSRRIIQTPLEKDYGIDQKARAALSSRPFALQLIAQAKGPFQAGLEIQIPLPGDERRWRRSLERIESRLIERGLAAQAATPPGEVLFEDPQRPGSPLVGGWRWIATKGQPAPALLSIGLGRPPADSPWRTAASMPPGQRLQLQARPKQLQTLQLLPGRWPKVVRDAGILNLELRPLPGGAMDSDWLRCDGRLSFGS